jgi:hypothetical protein
MSSSLYANLPTGHLETCFQDLLSNLQYANLSTGHLADCTQDLSANLLYVTINYLYARIDFTVRQGFYRRFIWLLPRFYEQFSVRHFSGRTFYELFTRFVEQFTVRQSFGRTFGGQFPTFSGQFTVRQGHFLLRQISFPAVFGIDQQAGRHSPREQCRVVFRFFLSASSA